MSTTEMDPRATRARVEEERMRLGQIRRSLAEEGGPAAGDGADATFSDEPAEFGSGTFEREKTQSMLEQVERQLVDLDRALQRIEAGTYGTCEACGRPIDPERLEARPGTRFCVEDQATATR